MPETPSQTEIVSTPLANNSTEPPAESAKTPEATTTQKSETAPAYKEAVTSRTHPWSESLQRYLRETEELYPLGDLGLKWIPHELKTYRFVEGPSSEKLRFVSLRAPLRQLTLKLKVECSSPLKHEELFDLKGLDKFVLKG